MQALEFCNGKINMSLSVINEEIRKMLPVLIKNGIIEQCEPGDAILPEQEYRLYPSRYISTAHRSVTGRCNYRCKHCYMSAPDAKFGELSHSQVMNIADQITQCGIREVSLTGGETSPDNLFAPDMAACRFFRDGWGDKIDSLMKGIV